MLAKLRRPETPAPSSANALRDFSPAAPNPSCSCFNVKVDTTGWAEDWDWSLRLKSWWMALLAAIWVDFPEKREQNSRIGIDGEGENWERSTPDSSITNKNSIKSHIYLFMFLLSIQWWNFLWMPTKINNILHSIFSPFDQMQTTHSSVKCYGLFFFFFYRFRFIETGLTPWNY